MKPENKVKLRNDILLATAVILVLIIAFAVMKLTAKDGAKVRVLVDGEVTDFYSLKADGEYPIITGENGENENILVIKDGEAFIKSANCPDKICVKHSAVSKDGQSIICLPHKVVVEVYAE